ncbi:phenol hydroxylase subunit [Leeia oryzae]|uniref:phenol hydroxylase subunit n=1 Tax=Leeia oryzae TaxID=356662 RepID=UPI000377347A|nr:phenol hydroxylase subunit [Leeia oryzae]
MTTPTVFDTSKKFVRIMEEQVNGLVMFEFSVGEPEMMVELVMPKEAFTRFCDSNQVIYLTDTPPAQPDERRDNDWDWRLRDATHQRFR